MSVIELTLIQSTKPATLTKLYSLSPEGCTSSTTVAAMSEGSAQKIRLSFEDFHALLPHLASNQAFAYGVTEFDHIGLCTKRRYEEAHPEGFIPRSDRFMRWPNGSGILLLDYDPSKGKAALTADQLLAQLLQAVPALTGVARVWWPSASSHIYHGDRDITGLRGQRVYIPVTDATDIPRAGKALADRLWLAGHGFYEVSEAGKLLERTLVDSSVWQPCRLDFAAGAQCVPPLEQRRGLPELTRGEYLNTSAVLPDLTAEEVAQLEQIKREAKAAKRPEQELVKARYIEGRAIELAGRDATEHQRRAAVETLSRATEHAILTGDFPLILESGEAVTVGEVLDDPAKYHGILTLDPLEPEYRGRKVVGKLYLYTSRPNLFSQAHGGQNFRLMRQPRRIELVQGGRHDAVQQTLELMRQLPEVYDLGDMLVTVGDGRVYPMELHRLAHWLGGMVRYFSMRRDPKTEELSEIPRDPDQQTVNQILALKSARNLKPLDAVITAPTMRPDRSILSRPGYDDKTRLLLDCTETFPPVPDSPTHEQVREAVALLMYPFQNFPFCTPLDRGVFLAALLSAVVRPALPTAPGFAFDAPVQGSGKTLLAKCLYALSTHLNDHEQPPVLPHTAGRDDEEIRKRLMSALLNNPSCLIWDNVLGIFDSAALAALLTSGTYTDRILGKSEQSTVPNRALFILTGNNICLAGDMPRRVLKCRIDPQTERPYARAFKLDPLQYVKRNRLQLVSAALTIMRGYYPCPFTESKGRMASFEQWDDLVRQPVAWLARNVMPGQFEDPMLAIDDAQASDPEQDALHALLSAIKGEMGSRAFTSKELHNRAFTGRAPELSEAITDVAGPRPTTRTLGRVLSNRMDRRVRGLVIQEAGRNRDKHLLYKIQSLE